MRKDGAMKRMMMAVVLGGMAVGVMTPVASATFIYDVHLADPSPTGTVTVDGTITVDRFGTLGADDVTDYALTFTSARNPTATIGHADRVVSILGGAVLTAGPTSLSVLLPASTDPGHSEVTFSSPPGLPTLTSMSFVSGRGITPIRFSINGGLTGANTEDSAFAELGAGGAFVLATAPAAVPEPSSLVTMGTAAVVVGYSLRKPRRAPAA